MTQARRFTLYVDSSYRQSVDQVLPFFDAGPFAPETTELIFRRWRKSRGHFKRTCDHRGIPYRSFRRMKDMPKPAGDLVLYPFNAQSNCRMCTNRQTRHVFVGHGESEKAASHKPILRIYDHVAVAGRLACHRLIESRIFTQEDVDGGRIILLGDTFVQRADWLRLDPKGAVLYAPTWEGGLDAENYSSIEGGNGFGIAAETALELGARRIAVKFHPNTGARRHDHLLECYRGLMRLRSAGFEVQVIDQDLNPRLRVFLKLFAGSFLARPDWVGVRLALVDMSGLAAVCLKQDIPHLVLRAADQMGACIPPSLEEIYQVKSIRFGDQPRSTGAALKRYFNARDIERAHKELLFAYHTPELRSMSPAARLEWVAKYVGQSRYWGQHTEVSAVLPASS
jgi:hypothetical protein